MTSGPDLAPGKTASAWKVNLGCVAVVFVLCLGCVAATFIVGTAMDYRQEFVPAFTRLAGRISGDNRLAMATIGWAAWAAPVAAVTGISLLYRRHRRLFYSLLLPCLGLVAFSLLLADVGYRGRGHEPWIGDLVATVPDGDAVAIGLNCASTAGWLAYFGMLLAAGVAKHKPQWARTLRLVAPLMMLPALVIALLRA